MVDIQETVERTLSDVKKLETQIDALLNSLKHNVAIVEADLVPIKLSGPKVSSKRTTIKGRATARDVSMEIDDNPLLEMDLDEMTAFRGGFVPLDSEVFLIPVFDKWVFGIVLANKSNRPLCHPDLVLTMATQRSLSSTFSYNVRMKLLVANLENVTPMNRTQFGIPYQDSIILARDDLQLENAQMVQPGCKILLTACFDHPMQFCGDSNEFTLLASICTSGPHMFSRSINACYANHNTLYNEETFDKHKIHLLTALSTLQDSFNLDWSKTSENINLESLYSPLGFENIKSEICENDVLIDTMASNLYSLFSGSMFKIEKSSKKKSHIRCFICTRSVEQMQIFYNHLYKWLQDRKSKGKVPAVKIKPSEAKNFNSLPNLLSQEVTHLFKLIHFEHKRLSSDASSENDLQWMKEYYKCLVNTDTVVRNISV